MQVFYLIMWLVLMASFYVALWKHASYYKIVTPVVGWMVGLSFFILLPMFILLLNGGFDIPESYQVEGYWAHVNFINAEFLYPFLVVWSTLIFVSIVVFYFPFKKISKFSRVNNVEINVKKVRNILFIMAAMFVFDWFMNIYSAGGITNYLSMHWYSRHIESIESYGQAFVLYQWILSAFHIIFTSALAILITEKIRGRDKGGSYFLMSMSMMFMVFNMIMSGNRIYIALLILYIVAAIFVYRKWRIFLVLLIISPILLITFSAWAQLRGGLNDVGLRYEAYKNNIGEGQNKIVNTLFDATEAANVMILMHIINDYGDKYEFLNGRTYAKIFTFFIPRSIYPSKQVSFTVVTGDIYEPEASTSLSSTVLGEMYANFGLFTVILVPMFTVFLMFLSASLASDLRKNYLKNAVLFILLVWLARSVFSDNFITMILALIIIKGACLEKGLLYTTTYSKLLRPIIRRTG